jgi:hypothetical protein
MTDPRQELEELRRLDELERKARGPSEDPGFMGAAAVSAGNWVDSKAAGLRGAVRDYVPGGQAIVGAADRFDKWRGVQPPTEQTRAQAAPVMAGLEEQRPGGMIAGSLPMDMAAKTPLGMALLGGMDPGTLAERGTRAAFGYGGGKAGEIVGKGISRALGPGSMRGPRVPDPAPKLADEFFATPSTPFGIPLTVGQATQNRPAQIAESVLANLPGSSSVINKARDRTFGEFNRAVSNTFGGTERALTPEVLGKYREKIGGKIGEIASRNQLVIDRPFAQDIARLSQEAGSTLTDDSLKLFQKQVDNVLSKAGEEGVVTGKFYQSMDTKLGRMVKGTQDGNLKDALIGFRTSMRDAFDRSVTGADSAAWKQTRKQYANLMTAANAAKNTGDGMLSPARLLQAVNEAQPNARFGSGTDLAKLAQWAKTTLPDKIPNSGTAQRLWYQKFMESPFTTAGALGGGAYGAGELGLGPVDAGAGLLGSYALARALAGKPSSKATEELLKRLGLAGGGAAALEYGR